MTRKLDIKLNHKTLPVCKSKPVDYWQNHMIQHKNSFPRDREGENKHSVIWQVFKMWNWKRCERKKIKNSSFLLWPFDVFWTLDFFFFLTKNKILVVSGGKNSLLVSVVRVSDIRDWIEKYIKQTVPGQFQSQWDFSESHLGFCLPILSVVSVVF